MGERSDDLDSCNANDDIVRTLFVSGLPANVRSREIYLLFRGFKGYEGYQLKLTDKQGKTSPVAFISFVTREDAEECKTDLQGVRFDPEVNLPLRIEFAKTNTKMSNFGFKNTSIPRIAGPQEALTPLDLTGFSFVASEPVWHHARIPYGDSPTSPLPSPIHSPVMNHFSHTVQHPLYQTYNSNNLYPMHRPTAHPALMSTDACTTLFVANLGKSCAEIDLHCLFGRTPGFRKFKMLNKGNAPCCFVEYQDVFSAANAMNSLQGQVLPSSEGMRGGIRIEYARSRMGEPRSPMSEQVITSIHSSPQGPPIRITGYT